jgi:hypothetical protein
MADKRLNLPTELDQEGATLVELVNRTIDHGVALRGDIVIQVADIDLVALSLDVVLRAMNQRRRSGRSLEAI